MVNVFAFQEQVAGLSCADFSQPVEAILASVLAAAVNANVSIGGCIDTNAARRDKELNSLTAASLSCSVAYSSSLSPSLSAVILALSDSFLSASFQTQLASYASSIGDATLAARASGASLSLVGISASTLTVAPTAVTSAPTRAQASAAASGVAYWGPIVGAVLGSVFGALLVCVCLCCLCGRGYVARRAHIDGNDAWEEDQFKDV